MELGNLKIFPLLLIFFVTSAAVDDADVIINCPAGAWTSDHLVTLTCSVKSTKLTNQTCSGQLLDVVDFKFTAKNSEDSSPECQVREFFTKCGGSESDDSCRCVELKDERYVFVYNVIADKNRYEGGSWRCFPACSDTNLADPLTYEVPPACKNIKITVGDVDNTSVSSPEVADTTTDPDTDASRASCPTVTWGIPPCLVLSCLMGLASSLYSQLY